MINQFNFKDKYFNLIINIFYSIIYLPILVGGIIIFQFNILILIFLFPLPFLFYYIFKNIIEFITGDILINIEKKEYLFGEIIKGTLIIKLYKILKIKNINLNLVGYRYVSEAVQTGGLGSYKKIISLSDKVYFTDNTYGKENHKKFSKKIPLINSKNKKVNRWRIEIIINTNLGKVSQGKYINISNFKK